jgi:AraC-like DNA-binding protein
MYQGIQLLYIACIIAIFQSLFMSYFFIRNNDNNLLKNTFLSLILFIFSILFGCALFLNMDATRKLFQYHKIAFIVTQLYFLIGPFVLLYFKYTLFTENKSFQKKDLLHLVVFSAAVIFSIIDINSYNGFIIWFYPKRIIFRFIMLSQNLVYFILILRNFRLNNISIKNILFSGNNQYMEWIRIVISGYIVIWLLQAQLFITWDILRLSDYSFYNSILYYVFAFVFFNTLVYFRMKFPEIFNQSKKYENSILSESDKEHYKNKLSILMEKEKIYLDPYINLSSLAKKLSIAQCRLSQIINETFGMNFSDYINRYRIMESQNLLKKYNGEKNIIDIAFECGFNSKSVFNNSFKKHIGITPKDFQKNFVGN